MAASQRPDPTTLPPAKPRKICPVCGTVSYSRGGIHPQCSQERADRQRMEVLRAQAAAAPPTEAKSEPSLAIKPWHRRCPRCGQQSHIRAPSCACGHEFGDRPRASK